MCGGGCYLVEICRLYCLGSSTIRHGSIVLLWLQALFFYFDGNRGIVIVFEM